MKLPLAHLPIICMASHVLVSCSFKSSSKELGSTHAPTISVNTINNSALTFKAKYGIDYEIHGNVIAKFTHFDLALFSLKTLPEGTGAIHLYELTSKDGFAKTHISCDPRHTEKKHFFLEGLHFYYHSNTDGTINIYMPPQLLALR